jgi:iron complex outermembrane receptor protein
MNQQAHPTQHTRHLVSAHPFPYRVLARTAIGAAVAAMCLAAGMASAAEPAEAVAAAAAAPDAEGALAGIVHVSGKALGGTDKARLRLEDIPGGVSVVDAEQVEKGRVFTNEDVLAFQPGVYAQAAGGTDGIKISIRGSAINRGTNFFRSGTLFLFDGLPVTGPGGTPYELFEPLGLSRTEVLRGANAFDVGALMLGGAINYVTRTGADAAPLEARVEGGSYGYRKGYVSAGQVVGKLDYYVAAVESKRRGYQELSQGESRGVIANLGYKLSDDVQTRFYLRWRQTDNYQPGALTVAQIEDNPRQANPVAVQQNAHRRQPGSTWLANKTSWRIDGDSSFEVGLVYHDYPIDQELAVNAARWEFSDGSLVLNYERRDKLFGRQSRTKIGFLSTTHLNGSVDNYVRIPAAATAALPVGTRIRHAEYGGSDNTLHAGNDLELAPELWLSTGVSAVRTKRSTEVNFPVTGVTYDRTTNALAPRLGLRYTLDNGVQVYANASRTIEPPNSWAFLTTPPAFTSGPATGLARQGLDLKDQAANTVELGTRGQVGATSWSLSVYRALVRNELLSVEVVPATATTAALTAESNAGPTRHQGIEAGLESRLWDGGASGRLNTRHAFTLNDFHFRRDARFGDNTLPGVPRRYYQGELQYEHPGGLYAGVSVQAASRIDVDYANSFKTHGYGIVNASLGYDHPSQGWKVFLDARNLANKHYVSSVAPVYNDAGVDQRRSIPGDGFGVFAGLSVTFR